MLINHFIVMTMIRNFCGFINLDKGLPNLPGTLEVIWIAAFVVSKKTLTACLAFTGKVLSLGKFLFVKKAFYTKQNNLSPKRMDVSTPHHTHVIPNL